MPVWLSKIAFIYLLLGGAGSLAAQDSLYLKNYKSPLLWINQPWVQACAVAPGQGYEGLTNWQPFNQAFIQQKPTHYWLRLSVYNPDTALQQVAISHGNCDSIKIKVIAPDTGYTLQSGIMLTRRQSQYAFDRLANSFSVPAQKAVTIYLYSSNEGIKENSYQFRLMSFEYYARSLAGNYVHFAPEAQWHSFILGMLVFAALFMALLSIWFKSRSFLYYVLFLMGALAYIWHKAPYYSYLGILAMDLGPLRYQLSEATQFLFYAAYIGFWMSLLDLKRYPAIYQFFKWVVVGFVVYAVGMGTWLVAGGGIRTPEWLFNINRMLVFPIIIGGLIWIGRVVKSPLMPYFFIGAGIFILSGLLAAIRQAMGNITFISVFTPLNYLKVGIMLEALTFAVALGYKMYLVEKEKRSNFQAYIQQLELNEQLMKDMNARLEATVQERTRDLEEQKEKQLRTEYEQQLMMLEMKALRSQMNPHFIFNSLNSIRYQIQSGQYKLASDYLLKFSKLLRLTLENSRKDVVTLAEELQLTRLYLEIEGQRFGEGFTYEIQQDEAVDEEAIELPPLLLQPYAENAVKHGLLHSQQQQRYIRIRVSQGPQLGECILEIEDNGIGRQASAAMRAQSGLHHNSVGMQITQERMALFQKKYGHTLTWKIDDLVHNNQPQGTRVTITYKQKHYV